VAAGVLLGGPVPSLTLGASASATSWTPPWAADSNVVGSLSLYDASGNPVTSEASTTSRLRPTSKVRRAS
jgi:hypothetical protein